MAIVTSEKPGDVSLVCPSCSQAGIFYGHSSSNDIGVNTGISYTKGGLRFCPNEKCQTMIFYSNIYNSKTELTAIDIYPKSLIDFDSHGIPANIVEAFKEALTCHAHACYKAAGTMIRRTLEELCSERGCEGKDLHARLVKLQEKIVIPQELLSAAFSLKLLGNDASHIEAKTYNEIGQQEIELAIELTKELLKSTYQYKNLLQKLESFKKQKQE